MREFQKRQLLDIITNLHLLHREIQERMEQREYQTVLQELNDCQEVAIQIGEAIEKIEGEGTAAVTYLEQYCEVIYQISTKIEKIQAQEVFLSLEKMLGKVENAIRNMEVKKIVVFMPYKASMWDSLESVWRAVNKDEGWESLVMPIPYFNKNADGSLGEMIYEGENFPEDVPITDWNQYSLEVEHPDIIFIHNPYDQCNYVTSIHPFFYSSKIRKYTDKLVYIPYFVHQKDTVKENYCVLPGVVYADVVVLQSDKVRQQYIKYFSEEFPQLVEKLGKEAIEQKFQALGSPKFDGNAKSEIEVPEEWRSFLAIGNKEKKVIFFNTHLNSLMKGKSEQFFQKLEEVFEFFKKTEDVVLLWRPHPLMVATAQSMNPEAVEPYLQLVGKYQREKIGIYDDSKDLHRAINLADGYYGDSSSVVELFRQQEKPIMIMNHYVIEEEV